MDLNEIPKDSKISVTAAGGVYHMLLSEHNSQRMLAYCGKRVISSPIFFIDIFGDPLNNSLRPRLCGSCYFRWRKEKQRKSTISEKLNEQIDKGVNLITNANKFMETLRSESCGAIT